MSVTGLCQICGSAEARFSCERCGTVVCRDHYDTELGYCQECAAETRRARGDAGTDGDDGPDRPRFDERR